LQANISTNITNCNKIRLSNLALLLLLFYSAVVSVLSNQNSAK